MKRSLMQSVLTASVLSSFCLNALGEGIPEPGLTMYGVVRNDIGGAHVRMTSGVLNWSIIPPEGPAVTVTTELRNINDQFSYVIEVPFEALLPGSSATTNALELQATATLYDRSNVSVGTNAATIVSAGISFLFSRSDRASVERVDLEISIDYPDRDGDGLPDYWEDLYFNGSADPGDDWDGDGLTNIEEYLSGCDPKDPISAFLFIHAEPITGGFSVSWSSQEGRYYTLERSDDLLTGFIPIQTGMSATPSVNTFSDFNVSGKTNCFYRVIIE